MSHDPKQLLVDQLTELINSSPRSPRKDELETLIQGWAQTCQIHIEKREPMLICRGDLGGKEIRQQASETELCPPEPPSVISSVIARRGSCVHHQQGQHQWKPTGNGAYFCVCGQRAIDNPGLGLPPLKAEGATHRYDGQPEAAAAAAQYVQPVPVSPGLALAVEKLKAQYSVPSWWCDKYGVHDWVKNDIDDTSACACGMKKTARAAGTD